MVKNQDCKYSRPQARRTVSTSIASSIGDVVASNEEESSVGSEKEDDVEDPEYSVEEVVKSPGQELAVSLDDAAVTRLDFSMYESPFDSLVVETTDASQAMGISNDIWNGIQHSDTFGQSSRLNLDCWNLTGPLLIEHNLSASLYPRPTHLNIDVLIQFPFLERFTNTTRFARAFECGTKQQRLRITLDASILKSCGRPLLLERGGSSTEMHWIDTTRDALQLQDRKDGADAIEFLPLAHKIVARIREMVISKSGESSRGIVWSPFMEALCFTFFNPVSIQKNLALFWSCWYPNWPVIHRPTFEASRKSPVLIGAMVLIGACFSPDDREHASAQIWADLIEDMVFSDNVFTDDSVSSTWQMSCDRNLRSTHLDLLQAAYCVCIYQTWEGGKRSKRRALRQRFSDLVYLARDIGLAQASLRSIDTSSPMAFEWDEYILRESLIRICSYISAIDASLALFYRHTPRMVLSELIMDMSSPESCFQASSQQECFNELKMWRLNMGIGTTTNNNLTILSAVEALHDDRLMTEAHVRRAFSHLSVLNMFTIIHALYLQVYRLETSATNSLSTAETAPIVNALNQWKEVWPSARRDIELADLVSKESKASTMWQRLGFIRHVPEYWLVAWLSLAKLQERARGGSALVMTHGTGGIDEDMKEVRGVLARFKSGSLAPV
ncbi:hypothetical protein NX059_001769 [Plenodomus lindquistii]|nr:hypothetical protein NX059_001769 [Plenodomus lindquistii]